MSPRMNSAVKVYDRYEITTAVPMSAERTRKTLRDYLLDGGVKDRYFSNDFAPSYRGQPYGGYQVKDIRASRRDPNTVELFIVPIGVERTTPTPFEHAGHHLTDKEIFADELASYRTKGQQVGSTSYD